MKVNESNSQHLVGKGWLQVQVVQISCKLCVYMRVLCQNVQDLILRIVISVKPVLVTYLQLQITIPN